MFFLDFDPEWTHLYCDHYCISHCFFTFSEMVGPKPRIVGPRQFKNRHLTINLDLLNSMRESGTLCDIILIVEGVEFPAHKNVLAASSPYFQAMFTSSFKEKDMSRLEIHGISHEAFRIIVNFVYTGQEFEIKYDNVESLLEAASFLQLNHVKDLCLNHLKSMVNVENFLEIREYGFRYDFTEVLEASEKFINFNFYKIVSSPSVLNWF